MVTCLFVLFFSVARLSTLTNVYLSSKCAMLEHFCTYFNMVMNSRYKTEMHSCFHCDINKNRWKHEGEEPLPGAYLDTNHMFHQDKYCVPHIEIFNKRKGSLHAKSQNIVNEFHMFSSKILCFTSNLRRSFYLCSQF
mgnify:CR=1 FL=1